MTTTPKPGIEYLGWIKDDDTRGAIAAIWDILNPATGDKRCGRCGHSSDEHRHNDADNVPATDPNCEFRCVRMAGVTRLCTCPDWIEPMPPREETES